jgi:two-component system LytT family response regulator
VYVLDDEPLAVQRLTRLLAETGRVQLAGSSTDPQEALAFLGQHDVDVLFLDIQMPGLTGFEVVERLAREPLIVFTTAYDQYAVDAFAVNSIDYLLKPIERERLERALDKIERVAADPAGSVRAIANELAAHLARSHRPAAAPLLRLASRAGDRTMLLDVARISHFCSRDKLTFAASGSREHVIDLTLADLEARLDPRRFVRIHRSTIVNLGFVDELHPGVDAGVLVRLKDERRTELAVARDRVKELKDRLGI